MVIRRSKSPRKLSIILVLYNNEIGNDWKYKLPSGWKWRGVGSGSRTFSTDEQFEGPSKNKRQVYDYLKKYFFRLQKTGKIKDFSVRNTVDFS